MVVTIETDQAGLIGVGEGGSPDTIRQCAERLIGRNPFDTERAWQDMYRAWFYPPGREKIHGLGALDLALWDLKGKALDVPCYDLMGGMNRTYLECYLGGRGGTGTKLQDAARAAMEAGYRAFRIGAASAQSKPWLAQTRMPVLCLAPSTTRTSELARLCGTARTFAKVWGPTATGSLTFTSDSTLLTRCAFANKSKSTNLTS